MQTFLKAGIAIALALALPIGAQASIAPAPHVRPAEVFALNSEIVVRNWVLCVSRALAEQVVVARQAGAEKARQTIAELQSTRLCAEFPEMTVILHEPVVATSPFVPYAARAFSADISIGGQWVSAFVVNTRLRG
jgi:hypothetical protein